MNIFCIFFISQAWDGSISTSRLKSDDTIVFLDPDFLNNANVSAICIDLRQIIGLLNTCKDFRDRWGYDWIGMTLAECTLTARDKRESWRELVRRSVISDLQQWRWEHDDDTFFYIYIVQFLPRCVERSRGIAMRMLSVCLSVRLSVKRVHCDKTEESYV